MELKFYYCKHCGKIIAVVKDPGTPTVCCGEAMSELIPNTKDGNSEKHVPIIKIFGNTATVTVSTSIHPSEPNHYIQWIILQTNKGIQQKWLKPGDVPQSKFLLLDDEKVEAAYEYCNIHSLWKNTFKQEQTSSESEACDC